MSNNNSPNPFVEFPPTTPIYAVYQEDTESWDIHNADGLYIGWLASTEVKDKFIKSVNAHDDLIDTINSFTDFSLEQEHKLHGWHGAVKAFILLKRKARQILSKI